MISSSVDDDEDPESLKLLAELLAEDGVDPNAGDDALWDNVRQRQAQAFELRSEMRFDELIGAPFRHRALAYVSTVPSGTHY